MSGSDRLHRRVKGGGQEKGRGGGGQRGQGGQRGRGRGRGRGECQVQNPRLWCNDVSPLGLGDEYCRQAYREHKNKAEEALKQLTDALKGKEGEGLLTAFSDWCAEHADQQFPGLGHKAYAIPPFFFKCYPGMVTPCSCTQPKPCPGNFFMVTAQESDQKGDNAQRKVGRAFRLLNEDLERKGETTLFIMSGVVRDNILAWVKRPGNSSEVRTLAKLLFTDLSPAASGEQIRLETDLMIVHQKGVTLVQVKSCGANNESQGRKVIDREVMAAAGQLVKDEEMFKQLMQGSRFIDVCHVQKVVAVPALTRRQAESTGVQNVKFLCKDDLFDEDMVTSECETNLTSFTLWWSELLKDVGEKIPPKCKSEIIGRYIGLLSTPVSEKGGGFHHLVRCLKDAIGLTARIYRRQMLTEKNIDWVTNRAKKKLVCLAGHEMCGVRQLLLYKARHFTHSHESGRVVVLYQSDQKVLTAFQHALKDKMKDFSVQSRDYIEKIKSSASDTKLLFIVGEVCAGDPWMTVLRTLHREFNDFSVWFMADPQKLPADLKTSPEFCQHRLDVVLCCPPAVQHLLHHVRRRDGVNEPRYTRDTHHMEVPTNGPIPLCIRHGQHGGRIADCRRCAEHVTQFLMENVRGCRPPQPKKRTQPATYADAVKIPKGQGPPPLSYFDLSVAILIQCPEENQAGTDQHIDHVTRAAPFFQCLEGLIEVKETRLSREMKDTEAGGVWVGCTDSVLGCTIDVAIFIPCEAADTQLEHQGQGREYRKNRGHAGPTHESSRPEDNAEARSLPPIPSLYWTRGDLDRYSPYNKTGIMQVGSRCRSQLILIVP